MKQLRFPPSDVRVTMNAGLPFAVSIPWRRDTISIADLWVWTAHSQMMEVAEEFLGVPRSCQVDALPFQELEKFIAISKAIETEPVIMFQFVVLDLLKTLLRAGLEDNKDQIVSEEDFNLSEEVSISNAFQMIQLAFLRGVAIDWRQAKMALEDLGARFRKTYGPAFRLAESE
jgi:hypothetical protein